MSQYIQQQAYTLSVVKSLLRIRISHPYIFPLETLSRM